MQFNETQNVGFWKEIYENILFYTQEDDTKIDSLNIYSIELSYGIKYPEIILKDLRLIYNLFKQLYIVIESKSHSQFAKLEKCSLKMKKINKIFQQYHFYDHPIQENHKIIFIFQKDILVIMYKNKLIKKFKGEITNILPQQLLTKILMRQFNCFRKYSLIENSKKYGNYIFKQIGDFIVIHQQNTYQQKPQYKINIYYMETCILNQMPGQQGSLLLEQNEKLKLMNVFENKLFIVTQTKKSINIFKLLQQQRVLIFSLHRGPTKPILNINYFVLTNNLDPSAEPLIYKIDFKQY